MKTARIGSYLYQASFSQIHRHFENNGDGTPISIATLESPKKRSESPTSLAETTVRWSAPYLIALYGDLVIDAPSTNDSQILDSLTEKDKGGICYHLGVNSTYSFIAGMPPNWIRIKSDGICVPID
jgi:hypothetical protein